MFSKANKYFGRLDVKLTFYYTSLLLIIAFILFFFIYYRLEKNLIKQVDKVLLDEIYEIKSDVDESDFNIRLACETFEKESIRDFHHGFAWQFLASVAFKPGEDSRIKFIADFGYRSTAPEKDNVKVDLSGMLMRVGVQFDI